MTKNPLKSITVDQIWMKNLKDGQHRVSYYAGSIPAQKIISNFWFPDPRSCSKMTNNGQKHLKMPLIWSISYIFPFYSWIVLCFGVILHHPDQF